MESMWVGFPQSYRGGGLVWGVWGEGRGAYAVDEDAEVRGGLGADVEVFHFGAVVGVCWCEVRVGRVLLVLRVEEAKMTRVAVTIRRDTPVVLYKTAQGSDGTDLRETRGPETYP